MATGINNLPFPGKVYNPMDILTAEELNEDVANIEALATGSGIGDGALDTNTYKDGSVTPEKLSAGAILLGYASRTTDASTTSASYTDVPGLSVSVTVPSGGRSVKVTFGARWAQGSNANTGYELRVLRGTTEIGGYTFTAPGTNFATNPFFIAYDNAPPSGSQTYKIQYSAGSGTHSIKATAAKPAFILAELV